MEEFNSIIGYDRIKERMYEILNVLNNPDRFKKLGAELPKGLILNGFPGVGKTVLAEAFIKASKRKAYKVIQNSSEDEFINVMTNIFKEAEHNTPSIIFLDDMDKYQENKDDEKPFNVLQALIDSVNKADVYIIATINDSNGIPRSLLRSGRFDEQIEVEIPNNKDAAKLVQYFLQGRPVSKEVIPDDITAIYSFHSCAQIKSVINHAAIKAAYEGHDEINIGDFINASVNPESEEDSNSVNHEKYRREIAYHEAGHLLVAEACVKGSIGFVCTKRSRTVEGVCHLRDNLTRRPYIVLAELGGKAAVETKFGWLASGADEDMQEAGRDIINGMFDSGTGGFSLLRFELSDSPAFGGKDGSSAVTYELERHFHKAKELIALNMPFLDAAAEELMKKGYLLASEIKALEQKYPIDSSPIKEI